MKVYALLARLSLPRSYMGKILLAAFLGILVPLICLVVYLLLRSPLELGVTVRIVAIVLLATLFGGAATLYVLRGLLVPVTLASQGLRDYLEEQRTPDLPTGFTDRAGRLMADVQHTTNYIDSLDRRVHTLEEMSTRDHLTGAYNRRACEQRLAEDIARVRRSGGALTLVMIDIDDFKEINDRYGHQTGDNCLQHVTQIIQRTIRESDWIARWGGDEFMLILWDTGEHSAEKTLDRITGNLRVEPVQLPQGGELNLTLSMGVSQYSNRSQDIRVWFDRADFALYRAKRDGRGRVFYDTDL